ncbi:phosphonate C-P lyase system protein PhnL [Polycladidibacter stylochi]|uniref:phosphonate C-P lyase system protein PhnL n=1 Tax=Polycladidibacter stylochi TaxID=1807766 RepID=UPI000834827D|nr:phosphonate C-P lyase system protein PhnL [Pseudovibrio stylochi]
MQTKICVADLGKSFTMHLRGAMEIPVIENVSFSVAAGECAILGGPSGSGKSSIIKMLYGNYRCHQGQILITDEDKIINIATASPREIIKLREKTIGYVSQFLRAIPRVPAINLVAEPLIAQGANEKQALEKASELLSRLNLPDHLWQLPPATFSGGEQQRVNIARGFIAHFPILLLDEPTASLDAKNSQVLIDLVNEKKKQGVAMLGILHDLETRERIADRTIDVTQFQTRTNA